MSLIDVFYDALVDPLLNQFGLNWYVIVFILFLFYLCIYVLTEKWKENEMKKRKMINREIDELKHQHGFKKNKNFLVNIKNHMIDEEDIDEEKSEQIQVIRRESKEIVKKYNGKPWIIVGSFILRIYILISLIYYLRNVQEVEYYVYYPIILVILSLSLTFTKKMWFFSLLLSSILYFVYTNLSGTVNLFLILVFIFLLINKQLEKHKRKKRRKGDR